eukprot:TRINITY_DN10600_c0_g1_i1.p2 TRINITY_DN10600_c0_g1~~TRINITY_DN10600_c0_g1_i1.p2  ORF type:complete len:230 (-),score=51.03 TRINITY_DN10600_c0_g1_i1:296-985(-)
MVKHNNIVPNGHWHKDWQSRIRTYLNQPMRKKARRMARARKAAAMAPRPVEKLRPIVRCPTIRYNRRQRIGRGFSLEELACAGISAKFARTVGIAIDHRRKNASVEGLQANIERLKSYKARLIIFPNGSNQKPNKIESAPELTANATQLKEPLNVLPEQSDELVMEDLEAARAKLPGFIQYREAYGQYKSGRRRARHIQRAIVRKARRARLKKAAGSKGKKKGKKGGKK